MFCKICNKKCQSLKNHIIEYHIDLYINKSIDEINKLYYDTYLDSSSHVCPICGNESKFDYRYFPGKYNLCCPSLSCVRKYQFNTAKEKWEMEHPGHSYSEFLNEKGKRGAQTIKKNLQEKYGEHIINVSQLQSTKDKVKQTCIERYGDYYVKTNYYKEQVKQNAIERYGVDSVNKVPEKINKYKQTCIKNYGTDNYFGSKENWEHIKEIVQEKYGVDNVIKLAEIQDKITETKKKNGTYNKSLLEDLCYKIFCDKFGIDNIIRQYKDNRYINPNNNHKFNCDFYIKSLDLFIEIQGSNAHGEHPYYIDIKLNQSSIDNINSDKRPSISLKDFTYRDIIKRSIAKYNKLNYIEIFFKKQSYYTKNNIEFILNNYENNTVNVFVYIKSNIEKINDSLIYYYNYNTLRNH